MQHLSYIAQCWARAGCHWARVTVLLTATFAGPANCYVLPLVLRGGKAMRAGKVGYSGAIRGRDPLLCAVRALAYHLMHRFTIEGCPFPDPR